jgi:hypothetical protein
MKLRLALVAVLASSLAACASQTHNIRNTGVADTTQNRQILGVVEAYRNAVEHQDTKALIAMASKAYWEDAGTPTGSDDYGFDGLRDVLEGRFMRASNIRYSMKYMRVRRQSNRAFVDVLIDASYTIDTPKGDQRLDKRDQNEMVLELDQGHWMFVSGM